MAGGNLRGVLGRTSAPWGTVDGLRLAVRDTDSLVDQVFLQENLTGRRVSLVPSGNRDIYYL